MKETKRSRSDGCERAIFAAEKVPSDRRHGRSGRKRGALILFSPCVSILRQSCLVPFGLIERLCDQTFLNDTMPTANKPSLLPQPLLVGN